MILLELFSGIGGFHHAFKAALHSLPPESLQATSMFAEPCVRVFPADINTVANSVYEANFCCRSGADATSTAPLTIPFICTHVETANVETRPLKWFSDLAAHVWTMSPPCQPFTRQGQQKDDADLRSAGLLHLIEVLAAMELPPQAIAVENVSGFELSHCRHLLTSVLQARGYHFEEHMLSPWQLGIPLERLRYYLLAWRPQHCPPLPPIQLHHISSVQPPPLHLMTSSPLPSHHSSAPLSSFLLPPSPALFLPPNLIQKFHGQILDVVPAAAVEQPAAAQLTRASTFTKAYGGKYMKGSGSLVASVPPLEMPAEVHVRVSDGKIVDTCDLSLEALAALRLRYFSPDEIASLMGFPPHIAWPGHVTDKQRYKMLGNSLSVTVVEALLTRLLGKLAAV